ncbi:hypothetical protein GQ457_03G027170 [Hibiscus cannabinus]
MGIFLIPRPIILKLDRIRLNFLWGGATNIRKLSRLNVDGDTHKLTLLFGSVESEPSVEGVLKFNVDGAARDKPGLGGCGVILRDWHSRILAFFSGPIRVVKSNETELQAISHALLMLADIDWRGVDFVVIESDFMVAVS